MPVLGNTLARRGALTAAAAGLAITFSATVASADTTHTVASGDTVSEIAAQHGTNVDAVIDANGLGSSALIYVGDELTIPDGSGGGSSSSSSSNGTSSSSGGSTSGGSTYTVSSGDTVSAIAAQHGVSVGSIIDANGLDSSGLIYVGDELTIPGGSSGGSASSGSTSSSSSSSSNETSSSSSASADSSVVSIARQHIGTPYVYGGGSPGAFDCSGFTQYVYAQVGIDLPRTSTAQLSAGTQISESEAQPGDLVGWPGHVGIYTGNGKYIAAHSPGNPLSERDIYMSNPTFIRVG